ncbi:Inner membrane ABC transporter permease protein YcjP [subsurface metagenome]|nr:ABC transporter permease subunit [Clostridia bacterium]
MYLVPNMKSWFNHLLLKVVGLTFVIVFVLFVFGPFVWIFLTSIKTDAESMRIPITWWPEKPTIDAYLKMWYIEPFGLYFFNSIFVALSTASLSTFFGTLAGYGFSRFTFRGHNVLMGSFLVTQMLSGVLLIGPYFRLVSMLGLYNTRISLIIAFTTICLPFATWMAKGYFDTVPRELEEAAFIDGCNVWRVFQKISVPLIVPGIVSALVFSFLLAWQDLLWALVLTSTQRTRVVTMALSFLVGEFRVQWPMLSAAALIGSIPSIILYICLERYLVEGLTAGAVKE